MDETGILCAAYRAVAAFAALWLACAPLHVAAADTKLPAVEFLNSGTVLPPNLPFSEAVRHGDTLYLSGQLGITPGKLQLVPGGIRAEARQALDNIRAVLEAHGRTIGDVVKCTVMLADMADWPAFNDVWRETFKVPYPARSALGANGLALGARVEVECIAAVPRP
jgi:2-iminobutanoate/2-iminopropanoate deaminase